MKQVEPTDGLMKMQLALPSMPSLYIVSFLYQSCLDIHKSEGTYWTELYCINLRGSYYRRRKQSQFQADSATIEPINKLINKFLQRLDPIDCTTYEPYLWENEKESYKRCIVLVRFVVQLNHMYTGAIQKLPAKTSTDSNILRCSQVPRFKYTYQSALGEASVIVKDHASLTDLFMFLWFNAMVRFTSWDQLSFPGVHLFKDLVNSFGHMRKVKPPLAKDGR